jgi:hypothetical protein
MQATTRRPAMQAKKMTTTKPAKTMLATTRMPMGVKTMTKQMTVAMLVKAVTKKTMMAGPTLTLPTILMMRKRKQKIWNK